MIQPYVSIGFIGLDHYFGSTLYFYQQPPVDLNTFFYVHIPTFQWWSQSLCSITRANLLAPPDRKSFQCPTNADAPLQVS